MTWLTQVYGGVLVLGAVLHLLLDGLALLNLLLKGQNPARGLIPCLGLKGVLSAIELEGELWETRMFGDISCIGLHVRDD